MNFQPENARTSSLRGVQPINGATTTVMLVTIASTFCLQHTVCYIPHRHKCSCFAIQNVRKNLLKMLHFGRKPSIYSEMSAIVDTTVYDDTRWQSSWIMNLEKLAETDIFKECASRKSTVYQILNLAKSFESFFS